MKGERDGWDYKKNRKKVSHFQTLRYFEKRYRDGFCIAATLALLMLSAWKLWQQENPPESASLLPQAPTAIATYPSDFMHEGVILFGYNEISDPVTLMGECGIGPGQLTGVQLGDLVPVEGYFVGTLNCPKVEYVYPPDTCVIMTDEERRAQGRQFEASNVSFLLARAAKHAGVTLGDLSDSQVAKRVTAMNHTFIKPPDRSLGIVCTPVKNGQALRFGHK